MASKWIVILALVSSAAAQRFEPASKCSLCHSKISSPGSTGTNIAPYALWAGSMKANSARDPYWKAKVREEVAVNPTAAALIEDKCLRCHAPAQQYGYRAKDAHMRLDELNETGQDGVTCSLCHQITAAGLGKPESFTAGFRLGTEEKIFGPHAKPFSMPMLHHTGYHPAESRHVLESSLCATCHTVITPTLDAQGRVAGEFVEQAPYLEWLASEFPRQGRTCQSCHMPVLNGSSYIAHRPPGGPFPPTSPRQPFGLHYFAGGNMNGPEMLAELLPGLKSAFEQSAERARESLASALSLSATAARRDNWLEVAVDVKNQTGHKLPTAYPSRRIWLKVTAIDAGGTTVFESGAWDSSTGELHSGAAQAHRTTITDPREAAIYEVEYADVSGSPTTSLLRAASYSKDNRLLPRGFKTRDSRIAPVGTSGDADFTAGSDRVIYRVPLSAERIRVEALYQSIKPAHASATIAHDSAEAKQFGDLYGRHRNPVLMAAFDLSVRK